MSSLSPLSLAGGGSRNYRRASSRGGASADDAADGPGGEFGDGGFGSLGKLEVLAPGGVGDFLGEARGDELRFGIEHEEGEAREGAELLGGVDEFLLEGGAVGAAFEGGVGAGGHSEGHVGAAVADADDDDLADVAGFLGVEARADGRRQGVGEGRAAAAGHGLEAALGERDGPRRRYEDFGLVALERNEGDLVSALVGLGEEAQGRTLGRLHAI
mmetsp:Transcript_2346/g.6042  ORF Transcript_2346/g.6042 Transcript_2346/m.6042 type:complete len:215 (-) Transcript_2346:737-1381(-)